MYENTRPPVSATTTSLPSRYYTDPAVFGRELERMFYEMWLHVGRVDDVAQTGDYLMREIGSESFLVVRDREGGLGAFHNVCRHRGTHFMSGENAPPRQTCLGGAMDLKDGVETLSMDGHSPWARLSGLGDKEARKVLYYAVLPNLLLNLHPDYMVTFTFPALDRLIKEKVD